MAKTRTERQAQHEDGQETPQEGGRTLEGSAAIAGGAGDP